MGTTSGRDRMIRWLQAPGHFAWRWFTGQPFDGRPRSNATFFARGTMLLDPDAAPRPPEKLTDEIRSDIAEMREELELRRIARRVDADREQDSTAGG